ncbi:MAG: MipA/OmpV family protein [Sulfuricaulis sp.]
MLRLLKVLRWQASWGVMLMTGLVLTAPAALAQDAPLWEFGMGLAELRFPFYRGADQNRNLILPLPYFIYRGDFFRSDRKGMRGVLYESPGVKLNLSVGAALPVSSNRSDARFGMPDLKPSIEFGPAIDWILWCGENRENKLTFTLPVRAAVSVESPPHSLGWVTNPYLNLDLANPAHAWGWNLGLQAGPLYATRRQNDYYYSVDSVYATPTRPAYSAPGGYSGMQFTTALSKRYPAYWVGAFVRYDSLRGAVYETSPLVRRSHSLYVGVGFAAIIGESSVRVIRGDDD